MPRSLLAFSRPWLASWLNERSLRPPMSVTRPTLSFLPPVLEAELLLPELLPPEPLSSLPHAEIANAATAKVRAIDIARNVLRCTAPPLEILLAGPDSLRSQRRSLRRTAVAVADTFEQCRTQRRFREARLDRGAGGADELGPGPPQPPGGGGGPAPP